MKVRPTFIIIPCSIPSTLTIFEPIRTFNRDARLFLWMTVINGIILSSWQLFFNIFMLEHGITRDFLGIINSLPSLTALLLGIPIGRLSDRIGRRRAIILGILCSGFTFFGQLIFKQPALILLMSALTGIFNMFVIVSISPLHDETLRPEQSHAALQYQLWIADLGGGGGQSLRRTAPSAFSAHSCMSDATNALAYHAVLIVTVLLGIDCADPHLEDARAANGPSQTSAASLGSQKPSP